MKERIRKQYFSNKALIVISILGIIGLLMLYFSNIFNVRTLNMLYICIYN